MCKKTQYADVTIKRILISSTFWEQNGLYKKLAGGQVIGQNTLC
jgi:hypothetical protein